MTEVTEATRFGITPADRELDRKVLSVWGHLMPEIPEIIGTRAARQRTIREALEADGVLTKAQLRRYYGADEEDFEGLFSAPHVIEPVHMRPTLIQTEFVGLTMDSVNRRASVLAHAAGTAQGRLQLGVSPQQWKQLKADPNNEHIEPDAVFTTNTGKRVAVEYDRGTYASRKVVAKLTSFSVQYDSTLWMVPPPVYTKAGVIAQRNRRAFLQSMIANRSELRNIRHPVHIMLSHWWRDDQIVRS